MNASGNAQAASGAAAAGTGIDLRMEDGTLRIIVRGDWTGSIGDPPPPVARFPAGVERMQIMLEPGTTTDARLLARLRRLLLAAQAANAVVDLAGLPAGMRRMLELSTAVSPRAGRKAVPPVGILEGVGTRVLTACSGQREVLAFIGETAQGLVLFLTGRARYRRADLVLVLQDVGARSLPIVSLVAFLFGAILAFISSLQLRPFGAQVFVANLVASGMALEMGALITAVVMAGRAGAAFAAQIGTMQVNEEVDALRTAGFAPVEFLVVPRVVALGLMTPLLTVYAVAVGIAGGLLVGVTMLDLSASAYWAQTLQYLEANHVVKGLCKSFAYGLLIALAGCWRGMQCGRSAQAVGEATTSAVVTSIVAIVLADAIITILIFELDL